MLQMLSFPSVFCRATWRSHVVRQLLGLDLSLSILAAVGKWETCFWFSTFPSAFVAGAVGMWESRRPLARFPRGSWKEWEACLWLSTLSTVPVQREKERERS